MNELYRGSPMDVYVINLDRHFERWRRITDMLPAGRLKLHRVQGIDGHRLNDRSAPAAPRPGALPADRTVLSRYEIACVLSHRRVWRRFLRTKATHCVVLEDDVYFSDQFAEFVTNSDLLSTGFDIIKLEAFSKEVVVDKRQAIAVDGRRIIGLRCHNPGSAGYMLTRKAAARLLVLSRNVPDSADSLIFNYEKYRAFGIRHFRIGQVVPAPVIQHFLLENAPAEPLLDSYIADRRGERVKRSGFTLAKLRRELVRPYWKMRAALSKVAVEFR